jgi:hemerythrin
MLMQVNSKFEIGQKVIEREEHTIFETCPHCGDRHQAKNNDGTDKTKEVVRKYTVVGIHAEIHFPKEAYNSVDYDVADNDGDTHQRTEEDLEPDPEG